jgi:hypothetical protein
MLKPRKVSVLVSIAAVLAGLTVSAPSASATALRTFATMYSDNGDYIGGGADRLFTPSLGSIKVSGNAGYLTVNVSGGTSGDSYSMTFAAPPGKKLKPQTYLDAQRAPFREAGHAGIDIDGDGRGCNEISGRFDVRQITTDAGGAIVGLWIVYEQHCEGGIPALFGEVVYRIPGSRLPYYAASDDVWFPDTNVGVHSSVIPIDVIVPAASPGVTMAAATIDGFHATEYEIRVDTCKGAALFAGDICQVLVRFTPSAPGPRLAELQLASTGGATRSVPLAGSGLGGKTSISLKSDAGDWVGAGGTYQYDPTNSTIYASGDWHILSGSVNGNNGDWWSFDFEAPSGDILAPGTTFDATRYPFNNDGAGMDWSGNGRGCNEITGTFTVNKIAVSLDVTSIKYLSLDFVQHCEGGVPALYGKIRYRVPGPDATPPAVPGAMTVTRAPDGRSAVVAWSNPATDFSYSVVRYSAGVIAPTLPTSQFAGYAGGGTSTTLTRLDPAMPLSVSVFAVDAAGNVGHPAQVKNA